MTDEFLEIVSAVLGIIAGVSVITILIQYL